VRRPRGRSAKASGRTSVNDAFQLLLAAHKNPHVAAERLYAAWRENVCRLWCNDNLLDPNYIRDTVAVRVATDADGRHRIEIKPRRPEIWEDKAYRWQTDVAEVEALLPLPPRDRDADASPPADLVADVPPRRKPGPPPQKNWHMHVIREVIRRARDGKEMPTAPEMCQFCEDTLSWQPDIRAMQRLLRDLLA
jgi:hypothetical protein